MYELIEYVDADGRRPFAEWLLNLKNKKAQAKIRARLTRASLGNFGDWKNLTAGNGICEMREHYGSGYRVFYKRVENKIILLLAGASKKDQNKVIEKVKAYAADYERRSMS